MIAAGNDQTEEQQRLERLRSASPSQLRQELSRRVAERLEDRFATCYPIAVLHTSMQPTALPMQQPSHHHPTFAAHILSSMASIIVRVPIVGFIALKQCGDASS